MKKLLALTLALGALVFTGLSIGQERWPGRAGISFSGALVCRRPAKPEQNVGVDRCHGNWTPIDNTDNWKHQPSQGPDHMVRKNGKSGDRSCMKCPNGGTIKQDFKGLEDWCVNYVAAVPTAAAAGGCPSGFTLGP